MFGKLLLSLFFLILQNSDSIIPASVIIYEDNFIVAFCKDKSLHVWRLQLQLCINLTFVSSVNNNN